MCVSICGQIGYLVIASGALIMSFFSLFWPHWYTMNGKDYGFVSSACYDRTGDIGPDQCKADIEHIFDRADYNRTVVILMIVGIIITFFSILWCLASFCACCCRSHFLHVLPVFSVIAGVLFAAAVITFAASYNHGGNPKLSDSFIIAACASAVSFIAALMAGLTAYCSDRCA
uniref:MARVEL domain-containing protein n=1 Tax=Panagrellus redivivus TaxID=6233 RepID=A0A7E4VIR9_PANRE